MILFLHMMTFGEDTDYIERLAKKEPFKVLRKAKIAKAFVESLCLHKFLYLNIDSEKEKDDYDRTLAVVIVENKNLNEILLKENIFYIVKENKYH